MACRPTPTATLFGTTTEFSERTLYSDATSTLPSTVTTLPVGICVVTDNSSACTSSGATGRAGAVLGGQTTSRVPEVTTVAVARKVPTETLFASCTSESHTASTPVADTLSVATAAPAVVSHLTTTTTAAATVTISSNTTTFKAPVVAAMITTLPNGSVMITTVYRTSSPSPSVVIVTAQPAVQSSLANNRTYDSVGPIIGGVVAGFVALIAIVAVAWFIIRRRKCWNSDIDFGLVTPPGLKSPPSIPQMSMRRLSRRQSVDMMSELEPKPYQYGLVGSLHRNSLLLSPTLSTTSISPPASPTQAHQYLDGRRSSTLPEEIEYLRSRRSIHSQKRRHSRRSASGEGSIFDAQQLYHEHQQPQEPHPVNRRQSARSSLAHPARSGSILHGNMTTGTSMLLSPLYTQPNLTRESYGARRTRSSHSMATASRPSTGDSQLSSATAASYTPLMSARIRHVSATAYTPLDLPDEFGTPTPRLRPSSAFADDRVIGYEVEGEIVRPSLLRTLTLTNWNPSTDAISLNDETPQAAAPALGTPWGGLVTHTESPELTRVAEDAVTEGGAEETQKPPQAHLAS